MFKLVDLEDTIRIPPEKFGEPIETVGYEQLRMKYEEKFFMRHDKHVSLRETLKLRKEQKKDERRRLMKDYKSD